MKKQFVDLRKFFAPNDSFSIAGIVIGLLIALFLEQLEIRLIGISIAILSAVGLFMSLSQRVKDIVGTKFKPGSPQPSIKITKTKSSTATHQVIENFDDSFGSPENKEKKKEKDIEKETEKDKNKKKVEEVQKKTTENFEFNDGFSGVKIIRKKQSTKKEPEKVSEVGSDLNHTKNIRKKDDDYTKNKTDDSDRLKGKKSQDIPTEDQPDWVSLLIDNEPVASEDPRKEFDYFISKILMAIRTVTNTRTAVFIFVNSERDELILESYLTEEPQAFSKNTLLKMGNDIISQIINNKKPEILTEISPSAEKELIPYYEKQIGTQSFIGLPVIIKGKVVGVLCADSDISEAYDSQTVSFMGYFIQLIVSLVKNYIEKYELLLASKTLEAMNNFRSLLSDKHLDIKNISESLIKAVSSLFQSHTIGTCIFEEETGTWKIVSIHTKNEQNNNFIGNEIDIERVVIGKSIISTETMVISPINTNDVYFHDNEELPKNGLIVAIPLKSISYNYGCLFLVEGTDALFTSYDVKILETLCDNAGLNIEQLYYRHLLQSQTIHDSITGILMPQAFFQRLDEECIKALDFNNSFSLCLFQIDNYAAFSDSDMEKTEQVIIHAINKTRESLKKYDILGKADTNIFGVILINANLQDTQLWAERLRSNLASSVLNIGKKRFTVTISIGIADSKTSEGYESLLSNAHKVLEIAGKKTNTVKIFG